MGSEKQTTDTSQQTGSTTTYTPTAAELELQEIQLGQYKDIAPGQTDYYKKAYGLASTLLTGQELPGYLKGMETGIDEDTIANQAVNYALNAMPGMQALGLTDSGTAARSIAKGIATDIQLPAAEYNSNLLLNLLNLASGQAATGTGQFTQGTNTLVQALAGLRSGTTTGTTSSTSTTLGTNPFLKSFQTSLGSSLGSGTFGNMAFG